MNSFVYGSISTLTTVIDKDNTQATSLVPHSFESVSSRYPLMRMSQGCWIWQGARSGKYGSIKRSGKTIGVHRHIYEELCGPIPAGKQLDHLCRNPLCCNPAHLEPVSQRENTLRGAGPTATNARKTHCRRGHPFDEENTIWRPGGGRRCRACQREIDQRRFEQFGRTRSQRTDTRPD
jgi:hypothetical protein